MTTTTSPLRVSSAQEAVDLLYNHFIKNRHRPAYDVSTDNCYSMPVKSCYPRCAVGILTKPSVIRAEADLSARGDRYCSNPDSAFDALRSLANSSFAVFLQGAHDYAAGTPHESQDAKTYERFEHKSFRSAFAASLRSICAHYNLEYPGDRR